jgi:ubiquinone/menaquinone biosynthesis C-methylase UbiE
MYQNEWNKIAEEVRFNLDIDLERFIREVPTASDILDFGCGYGRISKLLCDADYRNIVGVDSSVNMIERGRQEYPELSLEISSGSVLPFSDASFDAVVVCAVFTCITCQDARVSQMNELCRVLKPQGLLHMVEFCADSSETLAPGMGVPMLHSSPAELRELVTALSIIHEEVVSTKTISGNSAKSYSLFARKTLTESSNERL